MTGSPLPAAAVTTGEQVGNKTEVPGGATQTQNPNPPPLCSGPAGHDRPPWEIADMLGILPTPREIKLSGMVNAATRRFHSAPVAPYIRAAVRAGKGKLLASYDIASQKEKLTELADRSAGEFDP